MEIVDALTIKYPTWLKQISLLLTLQGAKNDFSIGNVPDLILLPPHKKVVVWPYETNADTDR